VTAAVDTKVEIWFDLSTAGGDFFTLDDDPKGKLDSVTYKLAGDLAVDITDYVHKVAWARGRSRELDEIQTGTAQVELRNYDGRFLPDDLDADGNAVYGAGNIVPGKRLRISAEGTAVFDGYVEDWEYAYRSDLTVETTITSTDGLGRLAGMSLDSSTETSQLPGARIAAVLDKSEVDYGANRDLDTGIYTLQADTIDQDANLLQYLHLVARSDRGRLFDSRMGVLTFRDRVASTAVDVGLMFDATGSSPAGTIPVGGIQPAYGSELLFNRVVVTRKGGTAQTSNRTESQAAYGIHTLTLDDVLLNSDSDALALADYLSGIYSRPQLRIASLTVLLDGLAAADRAAVATAEIGDVVKVTWTPTGMTSSVTQTSIVEGVDGENDTRSPCAVSLRLSPVSFDSPFALDSETFGVLDSNVLL